MGLLEFGQSRESIGTGVLFEAMPEHRILPALLTGLALDSRSIQDGYVTRSLLLQSVVYAGNQFRASAGQRTARLLGGEVISMLDDVTSELFGQSKPQRFLLIHHLRDELAVFRRAARQVEVAPVGDQKNHLRPESRQA